MSRAVVQAGVLAEGFMEGVLQAGVFCGEFVPCFAEEWYKRECFQRVCERSDTSRSVCGGFRERVVQVGVLVEGLGKE